MPVIKSADSVRVTGLSDFRKEIKKVQTEGGENGQALLGEANERVATFVIRHAVAKAATLGSMELNAADTMSASKSGVSARILAGGNKAPWFGGAEFGAYHDMRRLIKAPVRRTNNQGKTFTQKRTRATIVRNNEDIGKVARRVERQYVGKSGKTMTKKEGGQQVKLQRNKAGGLHVVHGWNQFRKWRGNKSGAGYFLFPTIRDRYEEIGEFYLDELDRITKDIFPD